jgi:protein SCO1/2
MRIPFLIAASCLIFAVACRSADTTLPGRTLEPEPAPDIQLTDSLGGAVSLDQYRGRPVVVTFLYTDCPDVCPVIGQRIGEALRLLGSDGAKVAVLVVSVDPEGDTAEAAQAFMQRHGLDGSGRHYLLGDADTLAPIWLAYGVGAISIATAQRRPGEPVQFGRVGHTDATYLIDRDGRKRTLLRGDATAAEIARGLRILLR